MSARRRPAAEYPLRAPRELPVHPAWQALLDRLQPLLQLVQPSLDADDVGLAQGAASTAYSASSTSVGGGKAARASPDGAKPSPAASRSCAARRASGVDDEPCPRSSPGPSSSSSTTSASCCSAMRPPRAPSYLSGGRRSSPRDVLRERLALELHLAHALRRASGAGSAALDRVPAAQRRERAFGERVVSARDLDLRMRAVHDLDDRAIELAGR